MVKSGVSDAGIEQQIIRIEEQTRSSQANNPLGEVTYTPQAPTPIAQDDTYGVGQFIRFCIPIRNCLIIIYSLIFIVFFGTAITIIVLFTNVNKKMDEDFKEFKEDFLIKNEFSVDNGLIESIDKSNKFDSYINENDDFGTSILEEKLRSASIKIVNDLDESNIGKFDTNEVRYNSPKKNLLKSAVSDSKSIKLSEIKAIVNEVSKIDPHFDPKHESEIIIRYKIFTSDYNRYFSTIDQFLLRYMNFRRTYNEITEHNANPKKTYKKGINMFADRSDQEINLILNVGFSDVATNLRSLDEILIDDDQGENRTGAGIVDVTESFDWRDQDVISPVRAQLGCGSCWAITASGAIDAAYNIKNGVTTMVTSPQHLLNCVSKLYDCKTGGVTRDAILFAANNKGICLDQDLPYTGTKSVCDTSNCKTFVKVNKYFRVPSDKMQKTLKAQGPIASAMAINRDFLLYESGIFNGGCNKTMNHAMLITGYGFDSDIKTRYWVIKNSWGENWGQDGYIKVSRDTPSADNYCMLDHVPYIAVM